MSNVENIYVRMTTNVSGDTFYEVYNTTNCAGDPVITGNLEFISENNYEKNIKPEVNISDVFSIKVIDSNGCSDCVNKKLPEVSPIYPTPTPSASSETLQTIEPEPTPTASATGTLESGTCYNVTVSDSALNNGTNDLYIEILRPNTGEVSNKVYYQYLAVQTSLGDTEFLFCSMTYPIFRYGENGDPITSNNIIVNSGSTCTVDEDCTFQ